MSNSVVRRPFGRLMSVALVLGLTAAGAPQAQAAGRDRHPEPDSSNAADRLSAGPVSVFVELEAPSAARVYADALDGALKAGAVTGAADAKSARQAAGAAGKRQFQKNESAQQALLGRVADQGRVLFRTTRAINGIALTVEARNLPKAMQELRKLPGVKGVHVMTPKTRSNSTSMPFLGIPSSAWDSTSGLGLTGTGIRIGVIDTGIDYIHSNFGGTGLQADYTAASPFTTAGSHFPTAKVVGGTDFAGDAYASPNAPIPDDDPMDCNGHGSHVAGTAAGFGVNADGTTFAGPYDGAFNYQTLRIGPGAAPNAELYALRVFGCTGSTDLTTVAIDWAMDPDDNGDLSDHLDVINMSLGSSNGSVWDDSAIASDNAAAAGVIVVASAGNAGDSYHLVGAPSVADRALSVAASSDLSASVVVNTPAGIAGAYPAGTASFGPELPISPNPGITGNVVVVADGAAPASDGCTALTNGGAISGNIAFVDRGTCTFKTKVLNAQNAGATAVIIGNVATSASPQDPPGLGDDATIVTPITISSVGIGLSSANTIKGQLPAPGVNATLVVGNNGDYLAGFSSRGPRRGVGLKPEISAPGISITSTSTGHTCITGTLNCAANPTATQYNPNNQALTISGTSMAAPHMAGVMALLRELHPTWNVQELKALAVDSASPSVKNLQNVIVGPGRVGGGRVDIATALASDVVAGETNLFLPLSLERLSGTYGTEVLGSKNWERTITVRNKTSGSKSYNISYDAVVNAPGVSVSFPLGSSITVPGKGQATFKVKVSANSAAMAHTFDVSIDPTLKQTTAAANTRSREWLTEEAGYIKLTSTGGEPTLRIPFHSAPHAVGKMESLGAHLNTPITLSGSPLLTGGTGGNPPFITGGRDWLGLVTALEWQGDSPDTGFGTGNPDLEKALDHVDIRHVGIAHDGFQDLYIGISTWGNWATPREVEFDVFFDVDQDSIPEYVLFNAHRGTSTTPIDVYFSEICSLNPDGTVVANSCFFLDFLNAHPATPQSGFDAALFTDLMNNNVMVLPAFLDCGTGCIDTPGGVFDYWIQSFSREGVSDTAGPFTYDAYNPGIDFNTPGNNFSFFNPAGAPMFEDFPGTIDYSFNAANLAANGSLGALLLHHNNTFFSSIERSEGELVDTVLSISNASVIEGNSGTKNMSFTVSLTNPVPYVVYFKASTQDGSASSGGGQPAVATSGKAVGSDFNGFSNKIFRIQAGQTSTKVNVAVNGDTQQCEGAESMFVNLVSSTNAPIGDGSGQGTIFDNDSCSDGFASNR